MNIFPAIDLIDKKAVRLYKGDYNQMTIYNENPIEVAYDFKKCGSKHIHLVDLEGAKSGDMPNADIIAQIKKETGLFCETGGGIRSEDSIKKHIDAGIDRIILGTIAVQDLDFLQNMVSKYNDKIAVGIDIKDEYVAIKGWKEKSQYKAMEFFKIIDEIGVKTVICTDISKDGAMSGTNHNLYEHLSKNFKTQIIASGGVSSIEDVKKLTKLGIYGAIIGKAYYTKNIDLAHAIKVANNDN